MTTYKVPDPVEVQRELNQLLFEYIEKYDEYVTQEIISGGADANCQRESDGETPLNLAIKLNKTETVKMLLEEYANPKFKNKNCKNALDAIKNKNTKPEIVKLIKEHEIKKSAANKT